ncbi:RagB/SusD family nutrient uptake outer membrane protein [Litoribacter alkaliphilus]|uniref:RagB/SusD family nutrient uptake outer membrane protein n=1 Tax=Litoribacter ruber TaxID=702568 RepID=A0AAP2G269_9BACT|nr:RagB/SusD family nutrient uptake outer membrane protein [Litoribacter alkaliphilus]MBS9525709.1 RagB/SusD family nutrient uptake outer membrane protein [Litoribacter alkaliphilus]
MKKFIYTSVIVALSLTSCSEDYLDRVPLDAIVDETFWENEDQLILAVNAIYGNIKAKNTVDFENIGDNTLWPSTTAYLQIGSGNFNHDLATLNNEWRNMYAGIRQCNNFLENYEQAFVAVPERREILAAEVRVIRAYLYSYLSELFGDVPLVTTVLDIDELYGGRDPKEQVVEFVLTELQEAADILPAEIPSGNDLGRIRKGAALGLKARVALYNGFYDVAEVASQEVMNLGLYELYSNGDPSTSYNDLFTYSGRQARGNNRETMIARLHLEEINRHNLSREIQVPDQNARFNPTKSLVDSYLCIDGLPIDRSPLYSEESYEAIFENRDPRMSQTILAPGSPWGGRFDGNPDNDDPSVYTAPKFRSDRRGSVTVTGYYFTKYVEPSTVHQVTQDVNDIHVLRYAEVLLTYAEAKLELGSLTQSDLDISINLLRERVGMRPMVISELQANQLDLREEIRRERRVELALEGQRYFDIKRWRQGDLLAEDTKGVRRDLVLAQDEVANVQVDSDGYVVALTNRRFEDPKNYLWPVPLVQLERNPVLGQNPGW